MESTPTFRKAKTLMNEQMIVAIYVVIDDVMQALEQTDHALSQLKNAEVLTVAVVAAAYFQNHHERALWVMWRMGYLSGKLSTSRFNRRLHQLRDWLPYLVEVLASVWQSETVYIIDSMPLPVCKRARAKRCHKVKGRAFYGVCVAKDEKFFGWRLHLVCSTTGIPVAFEVLPASYHDLTPIHELCASLPPGTWLVTDKAYNSAREEVSILLASEVRLLPKRKANMLAHTPTDEQLIQQHRKRIETVNSQLENMGIQCLHARTNEGFFLKLHASLLALICSNGFAVSTSN